jgi:hypothetical protein
MGRVSLHYMNPFVNNVGQDQLIEAKEKLRSRIKKHEVIVLQFAGEPNRSTRSGRPRTPTSRDANRASRDRPPGPSRPDYEQCRGS